MAQITVKNLSFAYEGSHDLIFDRVSFQFDTDWKLGFIGRNEMCIRDSIRRLKNLSSDNPR